jgi:hypothetical protein
MGNTYYVGQRGTGDVATSERPYSWTDGYATLYPNGDAPLTALISVLQSKSLVEDAIFNWWTETFPNRRAPFTAGEIYTDVAMGTAYSGSGTAGTVLFIKVTTSVTEYHKMFRPGMTVILRDSDILATDCRAKLIDITPCAKSGYTSGYHTFVVKLLEADDNGSLDTGGTGSGKDLQTADVIIGLGNVNAQGSNRPQALSRSPESHYNYAQIWKTALDITRTMRKTKLRTKGAYEKMKMDSLQDHMIQIEKDLLYGIRTSNTGDNGQPEYTTGGLLEFIAASGTVEDYARLSTYSGKTWADGGKDWLDAVLKNVFSYGNSSRRVCFAGNGALIALTQLAEASGLYALETGQTQFGMAVRNWISPMGEIIVKTHPLLSQETTTQNDMIIFDPDQLVYRYIDDTFFKPGKQERESQGDGPDATQEEWVTEAGLECHFTETAAWLHGVGKNNVV